MTPVFKRTHITGESDIAKKKQRIGKQGLNELSNLNANISRFERKWQFHLPEHRQRSIKRYCIYSLRRSNGSIYMYRKTVNLDGFKNFYNLGKTTNIEGFTPDYVGFRKSYPVNFENIFIDRFGHLYDIACKFGFKKGLISSAATFRQVWAGSPDSNTGHLRQFFRPNNINIPKAETIIEIVKNCPWFNYSPIDVSDPREINYITNFNPKAHPGHYFSIISGGVNKGYTSRVAYELAQAHYHFIRKVPVRNYALWDIFSREKDIKTESDKEPSTRVVLNCEFHVTLLYSWVHQKWAYANDYGMNWAIAGDFNNKKANYILKDIDKYDYVINPDDTFFDASNDTELIKAAGVLMFHNSVIDDETERFFYHIISSTLTKHIVIPPGVVVRCDRGNPSGHPGVTNFNCVLNVLRWSLVLREVYGNDWWNHSRVIVYGDDTYIMLKHHDNLDKLQEIREKFGFIGDNPLEMMYPTSFVRSNVGNDCPDFLKRHVSYLGVSWNTTKIFDKLLYQSRKRTIAEQLELLLNFRNTAPCDENFNAFVNEFTNNAINYYDKRINATDKERLVKLLNLPVEPLKFMPLTYFDNPLEFFDKERTILTESGAYYDRSEEVAQDFNLWKTIYYLTSNLQILNGFKKIFLNNHEKVRWFLIDEHPNYNNHLNYIDKLSYLNPLRKFIPP